MRTFLLPIASLAASALACGAAAQNADPCGLLVMAHGGGPDWNAAVEEAVAPIREDLPTEIAFGMADPETLQKAVTSLEARGAECISVVRLFMSGHSFLHPTEYLFGLTDVEPRHVAHHGASPLRPLEIRSRILLSREGLLESEEMGHVLAGRALALSEGAGLESVLVIAHGSGTDAVNDEWLAKLDLLAGRVRDTGRFHSVLVETLREDWPEKRGDRERAIRAFVESETAAGRRVIVVPFRLFGFGPYEDVLEGLRYAKSGEGLLPSPHVTRWIRAQANLAGTGGTNSSRGSQ